MKTTYKVNIGGCAFNMDEDAYKMFDDYFNSLKTYFSGNEESAEILSDIEMRVSELLQMRLNVEREVVSSKDGAEIIRMMGTPTDLGEGNPDNTEPKSQAISEPKTIKKSLYRDTDTAILGGVFGGLGHYLKFDPVILRAIYIGLLYLVFLVSGKISMFLVMAYFAMWIIMPKAKNMYEKLAMTGTDPSISNIENRTADSNKYRGSFLRTILKGFAYFVFGALALACSLSIVVIIIGFVWLSTETALTLSDYLGVFGLDTFNYKTSLLLIMILPFLGILYFSLKVLFSSRLAARDFVISGIAILVLVSASIYIGLKTYKQLGMPKYSTFYTEQLPIHLSADTITVTLDPRYTDAMNIAPYSGEFYMIEEDGLKSFFILPKIKVVQDSNLDEVKVEVKKIAFGRNRNLAKSKAEKVTFSYQSDSTSLVVSPSLYNKNKNWAAEYCNVTIYSPSGKVIVLDDQIQKRHIKLNNFDYFFD